ncbi:unnamed protein product, partial [Laminaria digitata]
SRRFSACLSVHDADLYHPVRKRDCRCVHMKKRDCGCTHVKKRRLLMYVHGKRDHCRAHMARRRMRMARRTITFDQFNQNPRWMPKITSPVFITRFGPDYYVPSYQCMCSWSARRVSPVLTPVAGGHRVECAGNINPQLKAVTVRPCTLDF